MSEYIKKSDVMAYKKRIIKQTPEGLVTPENAKAIPLTRGFCAIVDAEDYEWLNQWNWGVYSGHTGLHYAVRSAVHIDGKKYDIRMHRLITNCPPDKIVDHINRDSLDNRKTNLRICTVKDNNRNSRGSRSQFKGVFKRENRSYPIYRAALSFENKIVHLGSYPTPEEAAKAYDIAALKYYGEFALTNKMMGLL